MILDVKSGQKLSLKKIGTELKRIGFKCEIKKVNGKTMQLYAVEQLISNATPFNLPDPSPFG